MMIKIVGKFAISVGDPPQHWVQIIVDGEIFQPVSMTEEEVRDLKYGLESALGYIGEGKK